MYYVDILKSIKEQGRDANRQLKKACFLFYDTVGWDQQNFELGFQYINDTFYERIPEDIKAWYISIIEEGFFTMSNRKFFHTFIRTVADGAICTKLNFVELLTDLLKGIKFQKMLADLQQ